MTDAIMGDGPRPNWSYLNAAPFFFFWIGLSPIYFMFTKSMMMDDE